MKTSLLTVLAASIGSTFFTSGAEGRVPVQVDIYGTVIFNGISTQPLGAVTSGQTAHMAFQVDSTVFIDSIPGDVRAYDIIPASYSLSFSGGVSVGLGGSPAYFAVRDGDPVSDGFFVSQSTTNLGGVPLTQAPFQTDFHNSYEGNVLSSVDILSALGTYDFTDLTVFGYTVWAFSPDNIAMEIDFTHMTISAVPAPATLLVLAPFFVMGRRRR